ncbi:MAG: TrmH family RNA methyltransferase [Candidatus Paceibacterota bacterium]
MKKEVFVLLHNIRSIHNVGSIFRTSNALGINKIYLSGFTPTPLDRFNKKRKDFAKVSLGSENEINWEYVEKPTKLLKELKKQNFQIIGLEQFKKSKDYKKIKTKFPVIFLVGNEVEGIDKKMLGICDVVAEIPMKGKKESLNVSIAFGVGLFRILEI